VNILHYLGIIVKQKITNILSLVNLNNYMIHTYHT